MHGHLLTSNLSHSQPESARYVSAGHTHLKVMLGNTQIVTSGTRSLMIMKLPLSWHRVAVLLRVMWISPGRLPCLPRDPHRSWESALNTGFAGWVHAGEQLRSLQILQPRRDNPKAAARTYSTIHHCQVEGHNPLVRIRAPFHTDAHRCERHGPRALLTKPLCLRLHDLQTAVQKRAIWVMCCFSILPLSSNEGCF